MSRPPLTAERLHELLSYDPESGEFRWREPMKIHTRKLPDEAVETIRGLATHGVSRSDLAREFQVSHRQISNIISGRARTGGTRVGSIAGHVNSDGYRSIRISGHLHLAHRLAWLWMTSAWPTVGIDHRNGDTGDNRWENLREATHSQNGQNIRHARRDSRTRLLGVKSSGSRWCARIQVNGKRIHLGSFGTSEEAHAAYLVAKQRLHPFWEGENLATSQA